jgi:hypothetical protein
MVFGKGGGSKKYNLPSYLIEEKIIAWRSQRVGRSQRGSGSGEGSWVDATAAVREFAQWGNHRTEVTEATEGGLGLASHGGMLGVGELPYSELLQLLAPVKSIAQRSRRGDGIGIGGDKNTGWKPMLHFSLPWPLRVHGDSCRDGSERSLISPRDNVA